MFGPLPVKTVARVLATTSFMLLGLLALSGCDVDSYSGDLRYPVRTDWLVARNPDVSPTHFNPPGVLPLAALDLPADRATGDDRILRGEFDKKNILDPRTLTSDQRRLFAEALDRMFGTPADPKVEGPVLREGEEVAIAQVQELRLDAGTLKEGSRLYRQHCVHCHGLTGDGRGPTATWVNPHPRDYRQGVFKFTSTSQPIGQSRKARRDDLARTIRYGIENTSMPSFNLLPEEDIQKLASYVIHLSLRGEVEYDVMKVMIQNGGQLDPDLDGDIANALKVRLTVFGGRWLEAQTEQTKIVPTPYPYQTEAQRRASIHRGQNIFNNPNQGGCVACHKDYGRQSQFFYDSWGTVTRPTNFVTGNIRGGKRPIDLYWRTHGGINGSGMANFSDSLAPRKNEQGEVVDGIWDVVNFIQVLPYPELRQKYGVQIDRIEPQPH